MNTHTYTESQSRRAAYSVTLSSIHQRSVATFQQFYFAMQLVVLNKAAPYYGKANTTERVAPLYNKKSACIGIFFGKLLS